MNKTWLSVIIAAFFEVGWVIGLKHAASVLEWEEQSWVGEKWSDARRSKGM